MSIVVANMKKVLCFRPVSNRGPFACEANVMTTTLRKLRIPVTCAHRDAKAPVYWNSATSRFTPVVDNYSPKKHKSNTAASSTSLCQSEDMVYSTSVLTRSSSSCTLLRTQYYALCRSSRNRRSVLPPGFEPGTFRV